METETEISNTLQPHVDLWHLKDFEPKGWTLGIVRNLPLVAAVFGVPSGRGVGRIGPEWVTIGNEESIRSLGI